RQFKGEQARFPGESRCLNPLATNLVHLLREGLKGRGVVSDEGPAAGRRGERRKNPSGGSHPDGALILWHRKALPRPTGRRNGSRPAPVPCPSRPATPPRRHEAHMDLEALKNYRNWIGRSPDEVLASVIDAGGW